MLKRRGLLIGLCGVADFTLLQWLNEELIFLFGFGHKCSYE